MTKLCLATSVALMLYASPASADVEHSDADGFSLVINADSPSDVDTLWQRIVHPELWWNSSHTWSGDAANMSLDARAGGCWCEVVSSGGSVAHGTVVAFEPARGRVMMRAELGPLQAMAVNGWLEWRVAARADGGSHVRWRYTVRGQGIDANGALAAGVNAVLIEQIGRLAAVPLN